MTPIKTTYSDPARIDHDAAISHGWQPILGDLSIRDAWRSPNGNLYQATGHYDPEFVSFWEKR